MTIHEFTTELFCRIDDATAHQQKHSQARLHPSEMGTLGLLFALKGVGNRAFYRWAEAKLAGKNTLKSTLLSPAGGARGPDAVLSDKAVASGRRGQLRHRNHSPPARGAQRQADRQ
jgi:hypothetical protein